MEPTTKETFQKWAKRHDWVQFGEQKTSVKTADGIVDGEQLAYVTPAGNVVLPIFVEDKLQAVAIPMPPPPPSAPQRLPSGLNIPGLFPPQIGRG